MLAKKLMKIYLQVELLLGETSMSDGKFLVNKFDSKDGLRSVEW